MSKFLMAIYLIMIFLLLENKLYAYDSSTLYLSVFNGQPFTATLNGITYPEVKSIHTFKGLKPGKYKLKVHQSIDFQKIIYDKSKYSSSNILCYYGVIDITAKRTIYAYVDDHHDFIVMREMPTTTVFLLPQLDDTNDENNKTWANHLFGSQKNMIQAIRPKQI